MTEPIRFRRHPDVAYRVIDGKAVIVVPSTSAMHTLNEVGTFLWERCEGRSAEELVSLVVAEFEVEPPAARKDLEAFVADLQGRRMLVAG